MLDIFVEENNDFIEIDTNEGYWIILVFEEKSVVYRTSKELS